MSWQIDNSNQSKLTFVCDVGYWPLSGFTPLQCHIFWHLLWCPPLLLKPHGTSSPLLIPPFAACHLSCNVLHLLIVVSLVDNSKQSKLTFVCDVGYWPLSGFTGSSQYKALNLIFGDCQKDCQINKFVLILHCKQLDHYVMAKWQFQTIKFDLCLCCRVLATLRFHRFITVQSVRFDLLKQSKRLVNKQICTHLEF